MTAFVLVHGSGQSSSSWSRVRGALEARGHVVAAPELPKQAPQWGLEDYAAEVAKAIVEPNTVLVGHSLCGVLLPLVPGVNDCALLVFLAAVIPEPGKSVREQHTEDPQMFSPKWIESGARWADESQRDALAKEFLFHDCDEHTLQWALRTVDPIVTRQLSTQRTPLMVWPDVPAASIVPSEDRTLSPDWMRRISRRVLRNEPIEIRAGHCPHASQPTRIADILEQLGSRGTTSADVPRR